jgi:hypothetical protein
MAPSQSYGLVSLPPDATVKQQAQSVVGEVAEAMADALDLLDEQVHGLGRAVGAAAGGVEGQDFGLPRPDGTGKTRQLHHSDAVRPAVEALQRGLGMGQVAGGVDSAQQLLALPGDRPWGAEMRSSSQLFEDEHQIKHLALLPRGRQGVMCHQTSGLATMTRNCDHIATMPRVTGGDGCPTRTSDMAVDQDQQGWEGTGKVGWGRVMADYGSGGWGFESLAARHHHRSSAAL